jgi:hypothetical protein
LYIVPDQKKAEYIAADMPLAQLRAHDDPMDFLAGIDLILRGISGPMR